MDWTSVYVESGEEDLLIPLLLEEHPTAPRLSLFVSRLYHATDDDEQQQEEHDEVAHHRLFQLLESHPTSSYTLQALYYLCINFILGGELMLLLLCLLSDAPNSSINAPVLFNEMICISLY